MSDSIALEIEDLVVRYPSKGLRAQPKTVIDGVSLRVAQGETLALVGESGSGKTTIGKAVLGLAPVAAGSIRLGDREISALSDRRRRALAPQLQAVFQNPYGSLNPSLTIGRTLAEPLLARRSADRSAIRTEIAELLMRVGLPADAASRYPAQFSGGQRQRIAIARALALRPAVIVCDEPTSALDVTTQAAALGLLRELQADLGCSYLFITHDLAVVREFAHRTAVLEQGRIIEVGTSAQVCDAPAEPYTQRLVAAAPVPDPRLQKARREARLAGLS